MAEGARLESVYRLIAYRGFESLSLRQIQKSPILGAFLYLLKIEDDSHSLGSTKRMRLGRVAVCKTALAPEG